MCDSGRMAQDLCVLVGVEDRERLAVVIGDRNRPHKHVQRARIVLHSADRLAVAQLARLVGVSRPAVWRWQRRVWRWQRRFAQTGVDGLLHDKTRRPGKAPVPARDRGKGVLALTCAEPPGQVTHWTGRAMAKVVGISLCAVQRIWEAHRLQPHRSAPSSARTTSPSPRRSRMSSGSTSALRHMPSCSRSVKKAKFRRSIAPSQACP